MNKKNTIIIFIITLLVLAGVAVFAFTQTKSPSTNGTQNGQAQTTESETYKQYATLKGEDYDRMFLPAMIAHHQGAIDMANAALAQAKHPELKRMAQNIITAQDKEIMDMTVWQTAWGYSPNEAAMDHSAHGSMNMESDMAAMNEQLKGLSGDDFDKKFLELMIEHHQSAIDMAQPGEANAQHQEIKTLAKAIVNDQTKEIDQMKSWQSEWGY